VTGHVPIRTCVGCGERAPQAAMIRVARTADGLCPDPGRRQPGRGAYLHPVVSCWESFAARRGPVRSLRATPTRAERERLVTLVRQACSDARLEVGR
jgi:predicted RNA-binding protein YlxR (DUF448 family)